jgi:type IV pilus assembly protein PilY1
MTYLLSVLGLSVTLDTADAAELTLASSPLYLGTLIDPNIFFMLDDSGSMDWEVLTKDFEYYFNYWGDNNVAHIEDGLFTGFAASGTCSGRRDYAYIFDESDAVYNSCSYAVLEDNELLVTERDWRIRSAALNVMYYNPAVNYGPWVGYPNASFTAARSNPQSGSDGYSELRDLTGFKYEVYTDDHGYSGLRVDGPNDVNDTPNGRVDLYDSHTTYTVNASNVLREEFVTADAAGIQALPDCDLDDAQDSPPYADCFGTVQTDTVLTGSNVDGYGRSLTEVKQNIANWYQYYRKRSFVAKDAISRVISSYGSFRYGLSVINDYSNLFFEVPADGDVDYSDNNAALIQALMSYEWDAYGTPLRRGLERVGRYYSNYYSSYANPITASCQQNYSLLCTDGYWNGSSPYTSAIGDEDGDGINDTVADVARYFYEQDLSPLPNQVATTLLDDNNKQHMVTFTVAFGVTGDLVDTDNDNYPDPELTESDDWGNPFSSDPEKIDDLWHAAYNSKGYFVSAKSPEEVVEALAVALSEISDRVGSSASVATNTGSLKTGSAIFQARFDSTDWRGELLKYEINTDGSIEPEPEWDAGSRLNLLNYNTGRELITWNPDVDVIPGGSPEGEGIPFRFPSNYNSPNATTEMSAEQVQYLMAHAPHSLATGDSGEIADNQDFGEDIVNYLRGDKTNQGAGRNFRYRNSVMGDIVNSDPKYVGAPAFRYPDSIEPGAYSDFATAWASRAGIVYVGANDGILHAFNSETGQELMGYVPNAVYKNLAELATTDYIHRYFVDGSPNIVDAYFAGMLDPVTAAAGTWRTVLAGGLGAGGQAVYALDVTDPSLFDESTAADVVLWEFDDSDDADLGYTFGKPQIAKMADGKWVAVFGNGYNNTASDGNSSSTGHAVVYVVDVQDGSIIKKFDTQAGSSSTPNGMATPLLIDADSDFIVDYIYAGDLEGNLWKLDVTSSSPSGWDFHASSSGVPQPLFTTDASQPITTQPQAAFHPDKLGGFMVYFGTGKYLEVGDNDSFGQPTQTFYGIWDKNQSGYTNVSSSDLLTQYIANQYTETFDTDDDGIDDKEYLLRDMSDNEIDWSVHKGFKVQLLPQKVEGVANASNFGERQVSNAIVRGGRLIFSTLLPSQLECEYGGLSFLMELDYRDGSQLPYPAFDLNADGAYTEEDTDAAGRSSTVGIMPTVSIMYDGSEDVAYASGASGDIDVIELNIGSQGYGRQSWRKVE